MILNVLLKNKITLILFMITAGCSQYPLNRTVSPIDARYKLQKLNSTNQTNTTIGFYQQVLRKAWGSHCRWLPSDSSNARLLAEKCGGLIATPKAMARFFNEPNAPQLGYDLVVTKGKVYFEDLPRSCDLF